MAYILDSPDWISLNPLLTEDTWTTIDTGSMSPPAGASGVVVRGVRTSGVTGAGVRGVGWTDDGNVVTRWSKSNPSDKVNYAPLTGGQFEAFAEVLANQDMYIVGWLTDQDIVFLPDAVEVTPPNMQNSTWHTADVSAHTSATHGLFRITNTVGSPGTIRFRKAVGFPEIGGACKTHTLDYVLPLTGGKCDFYNTNYASTLRVFLIGYVGSGFRSLASGEDYDVITPGTEYTTHGISSGVDGVDGVPCINTASASGSLLAVRAPGDPADPLLDTYGMTTGVIRLEGGVFEARQNFASTVNIPGYWTAAAGSQVSITGVNAGTPIVSGGPISIEGTQLDTVTRVTIGDGTYSYDLTIASATPVELTADPVNLLDTPLGVGVVTVSVESPINNDSLDDVQLQYIPQVPVLTVQDGAGYVLDGLPYEDGDQFGVPQAIGVSSATATPDGDVIYNPALPHGTTHDRIFYDRSAGEWGVGDVTVNWQSALDQPPVWRAPPSPGPARLGVPYEYLIGALVDGTRPMTMSDAGTPLPEGLSYGVAAPPNAEYQAIVGTPVQAGTTTGIVARAANSVGAEESAPFPVSVEGYPVLSGIAITEATTSGYSISVNTDQGRSQTVYWIATRNPLTPTAEMIKAGLAADGQKATASGSRPATAAGVVGPMPVAPLASGTVYYSFAVQQAVDGLNFSNTLSAAGATLPDPAIDTPSDPLVSFYARPKKQNAPDFGV